MKLYDEVITSWEKMISSFPGRNLEINNNKMWPDAGKNNMVLLSDMAYELGGRNEQFAAIGGTAITSDTNLVQKDEIILLGSDLTEITEDLPYARIAICKVDDAAMGEGDVLFNAVKNIDYTRYHVSPEGFMMRVSSFKKRESVRLSKDAIANGISFSDVGKMMIDSFHKNKRIEAVKVIFINLKDFPYKELEETIKQSELITKAIDHILKDNVLMDCKACSLQKVCDEVEGMRELHFKKNAENQ